MKLLATTLVCSILSLRSSAILSQEKGPITREYGVGGIVGAARNSPLVIRPSGSLLVSSMIAGPYQLDPEKGMSGLSEPEDPTVPRAPTEPGDDDPFAASPHAYLEAAELEEMLRVILAALGDQVADFETWGTRLRVTASPEAHAALEGILEALDRAAAPAIHTEALLLPVDALDRLEPSWRTAGPHLAGEVFEKALLDGRARLLSVTSRAGQRAASGTSDLQPLVVDAEVNQTGVIPVVTPVIGLPLGGERLEVCAFPLPGADRIWLECAVGRFQVSSKKTSLGFDWGDLDLPITDETILSVSTVAREGQTLVAGALEGRGTAAVLLRVRISRSPAAPAKAGAGEAAGLAVHNASLLLPRRPARRWPSRGLQGRLLGEGNRFRDSTHILEALGIEPPAGEVTWGALRGEWLMALGPAAARKGIEDRLAIEFGRLARLAAVEVEVLSLPRPLLARLRALEGPGGVLDAAWEKEMESQEGFDRRRFLLSGAVGQMHALTRAKIRTFVHDVYLVSGGTGFAIIQAEDPETGTCGDGVEIRAVVEADDAPGGVRLRIEGGEARILEEREVKVTFPATFSVGGVPAGQDSPAPGQPAKSSQLIKTIPLTLPRQSVQSWQADRRVPLGRHVVLSTDLPEGDAATVVVGRVRLVE